MRYYSKIDNDLFLFFTIEENYLTSEIKNNFVKISFSIQPKDHRKIQTKEYTIHPTRIHIKTIHPNSTKLIGDYKRNPNYETILNVGYSFNEYLINVFTCNYNDGFSGNHRQPITSLPRLHEIIEFPDDLHRPFWVGVYFTSYSEQEVKLIFLDEEIDKLIYISQDKSNVIVLIRFLIPEWEKHGIENPDYTNSWVNPTFVLSKLYHIEK